MKDKTEKATKTTKTTKTPKVKVPLTDEQIRQRAIAKAAKAEALKQLIYNASPEVVAQRAEEFSLDLEAAMLTREGRREIQEYLGALNATYHNCQQQRVKIGNRMGLTADGLKQNVPLRTLWAGGTHYLAGVYDSAYAQEKFIAMRMKEVVQVFPVWKEFMLGVKGCGEISAAAILSTIDIDRADTVSKLWQLAGFNPSMILGKIRVETDDPDYTPKEGVVFERRNGYVIVQTNKQVRGDRYTDGFNLSFNKAFRTQLIGVLAPSLIQMQDHYCFEYYYPEKERLANSSNMTTERVKGRPDRVLMWKDTILGHRDAAAKRKMIKMFLRDLYVVWRKLEGLEVRETYQERYLGHAHTAKPVLVPFKTGAGVKKEVAVA